MLLPGSVVLVAGGASGLGAGTARLLVEEGARVAVLDLPTSRGAELAEELGDRCSFTPMDITRTDEVEAAVDGVIRMWGRLDVCVCSAGISESARVVRKDGRLFPLETFRRTLEVNLLGLFDVVRHAAGHMATNQPGPDGERGLIVTVASIAGYEGQVGQAAYAASKGAVIALTLPLARDLAEHGIRVMTICPGVMDTPMVAGVDDRLRAALSDIPVFPKRLGTPRDFALLVRSFMENTLLNGEVVRLDAATRLSPR